MWEYLELLDRLDDIDPSTSKTSMYRVAAPSPIDVDDSFLGVDPTDAIAQPLGSYPLPISLLKWIDLAEYNVVANQATASQLGALMTLMTDRRVQVSASEITIGMEGTQIVQFLPSSINDPELNGPIVADVKGSIEFISRHLRGLGAADAEAICAAIELHYAATLLHDSDVNTATTLLVAGIETLAAKFQEVSVSWENYSDRDRFDKKFTDLGLSEYQAREMREEILKGQHLRLQNRFVSYVIGTLPESFWEVEVQHYSPSSRMLADGVSEFIGYQPAAKIPITNWVPRDTRRLRKRLESTYSARSRYVHAGSKFHDMNSALHDAAGQKSGNDAKQPIGFAGLRRILRELIFVEIGERGEENALPDLRLRRTVLPEQNA